MSAPTEWQANLSAGVVELIREQGIYHLGGNDGCPCTSFEVRNVHVDVSCHKSDQAVRVYTHHDDWSDARHRTDDRLLAPIAEEVLRQVDAYYDAGGEYAAEFSVHYRSWERDNPQFASGTLTEGGDVKQAPSDSLSGPTGNAGDAQ